VFNLSLKILLSILFVSFVSHTSTALTGEEISNQVDQWLLKEGVVGKSVFPQNVVYKDCKDNLKISKVFKGYKTIRVNCSDKNILNVAIRVKLQDRVTALKSKKELVKKTNKLRKKTLKIKVKKSFKVIKLNKTLEKKSVLKLEDLDLIFSNNKNELIGRKLKQNLKMGQLLHPRHLYEKFEIENGDFLSITSSIGNASVTVSGEAQSSGNLGDLIRVKNLRSGKIIKGYIKKNKIIKVFR
jgi:flagella basal body P-ring formation protein FlgA